MEETLWFALYNKVLRTSIEAITARTAFIL